MSYKILSLDGGGSWALIQARILQDIYGDIKGHELLKKFDLVIANSGGSLVLACLCNNMRLSGENEGDEKLGFGSYREAKKRWVEIELSETRQDNKSIEVSKSKII